MSLKEEEENEEEEDDENLNVCDDSMDYNDLSSENDDLHSSSGEGSQHPLLGSIPGGLSHLHAFHGNSFPDNHLTPNLYNSFFGAASSGSLGTTGYLQGMAGWPHFALSQGTGFGAFGLSHSKL